MSDSQITVALPSLIHRIGGDNAKELKALALQNHCEVKRVRRSRNWILAGELKDIELLALELTDLDSTIYRFVIDKLASVLNKNREQLEPIEIKLAKLISNNESITLHQLMEETGCTLAQVRTARLSSDDF